MSASKTSDGGRSRLLVVDDDSMFLSYYETLLSGEYEVHTAETGAEALEVSQMITPDLILLDVDMPDLNGYDTCRKLREFSTAPIVFVTALQSMEEHLKAFDAGGDDLLTKPLQPEILLRKVGMAIRLKHKQDRLAAEAACLQTRANDYLSSMGESLALLNFVRRSLQCRNFEELVINLTQAMSDCSLEGSVVIRHGGESAYMTTHGPATALEQSILDKSRSMGRKFQFKRNLVVNYEKVSIIVSNMPPEGTERNQQIRDNIGVLAETAEAFCENVDMRKVSMERAESMQIALFEASKTVESIRDKQTQLFMAVRLLLHGLTDKIEQSYSWLGTSSDQEAAISAAMNDSVQQILDVLTSGSQMNEQFAAVVHIMKGGDKQNEIDLF